MKLYYKIMLNAIQSNTTYRFHTLITSFNQTLNLLVQISLWAALYKGTDLFSRDTDINLHQMITYAILSAIISITVSNGNIWIVSNKVSTGEIAINLIKPIGLFRATLFEQLGSKIYSVLFEVTPILLIGILVFQIKIPSGIYMIIFFLSLVLSYLVYFLITFLLGLMSFWYVRVFHLDFVLNQAIRFFSGSWIPLWFFPETLYQFSMLLPFELVYFSPISIFLGKISLLDIPALFYKYFIYIVLLGLLNVVVWRFGIKRLVIQGG
ncbi:hypothetical protein D3C74_134940 [compost metagenome]